ncbi:MAG: ABC transporter ATP-binding protein [Ruminococcaceae bacterium]|nr:ABC transporter ATP-binding protein [Oscillospiraceae bacterium]
MNIPVLNCENIYKSYQSGRPVLRGLNLTLPAGRIIGLLGPNGCGKSTLIKLIAGLLVPDRGNITICGQPRSEATNALISYLPERPYFQSNMRVVQLLDYFSDFYADFDRSRAIAMLNDLGIAPDARMRTLSKGTKEKVQLVLVMSRRAKLYLLDEPIAGVDPAARDYILRTIISNYSPDATVVLTTHLITDIEPVLDDFVFMGHGGQILLAGNADEVREAHQKSLNELFREVFRC